MGSALLYPAGEADPAHPVNIKWLVSYTEKLYPAYPDIKFSLNIFSNLHSEIGA